MARFCANCGAALEEGARFCGGCGSKVEGAAPPPPAPVAAAGGWSSAGAQADGTGLPPEAPLWGFQANVIGIGEQLVAAFGLQQATGFAAILARIIRGTFLDSKSSRAVAVDEQGTANAILALLFVNLPSLIVSLVGLSMAFRFGVMTAVVTIAIGVAAVVGACFVLAQLSQPVLGVRLTFGQLLRALGYVQGANLLTFIPVLGFLLGLWNLVASTAAIRAISGADTGKAIVFLLIGAVIVGAATMLISPLLFGMFAILR